MEDKAVYVAPWSIVVDGEGRLWIRGDHRFSREPGGTRRARVAWSGESIVVDKDSMGDHNYERRSPRLEGSLPPVVLK